LALTDDDDDRAAACLRSKDNRMQINAMLKFTKESTNGVGDYSRLM
jgi:hypothetical protein